MLKEKNLQPRILYPEQLSFRKDGEIKNFPDKQNLKEYNIVNSVNKINIKRSSLNRKKESTENQNWKVITQIS